MSTPPLVLADKESKGAAPWVEVHREHRRMEEMQKELSHMKLGFTAIADTCHELRTSLNSIGGFIQLMLDGDVTDPETQKEFLAIVDEETQRLTNVVISILDIAARHS